MYTRLYQYTLCTLTSNFIWPDRMIDGKLPTNLKLFDIVHVGRHDSSHVLKTNIGITTCHLYNEQVYSAQRNKRMEMSINAFKCFNIIGFTDKIVFPLSCPESCYLYE